MEKIVCCTRSLHCSEHAGKKIEAIGPILRGLAALKMKKMNGHMILGTNEATFFKWPPKTEKLWCILKELEICGKMSSTMILAPNFKMAD